MQRVIILRRGHLALAKKLSELETDDMVVTEVRGPVDQVTGQLKGIEGVAQVNARQLERRLDVVRDPHAAFPGPARGGVPARGQERPSTATPRSATANAAGSLERDQQLGRRQFPAGHCPRRGVPGCRQSWFSSRDAASVGGKQQARIVWAFFSLKGWNKTAQGNALGPRRTKGPSPEKAQQMADRACCCALSGLKHRRASPTQGVALGYLVWPLRGR